MTLNKDTVKKFQDYLARQFTDVIEIPGVPDEFHIQRGSRANYDPTSGEIKVTLTFVYGNVTDGKKRTWDEWATLYNLENDDFGKTFISGGHTYEITGLRTNRCKRPIIAKRTSGRAPKNEFVFPVDFVRRQLHPDHPLNKPRPLQQSPLLSNENLVKHPKRKPAVVRFKHEDQIGRGPIGPVVALNQKGDVYHEYGWLTRSEAEQIAKNAGADFIES